VIVAAAKRLYRRSTAGRLAGVCAGIAEYLDADVTLIRLLWILLSIVPGGLVGGVVAYIVAWAVMPDAPGLPVGVVERRRLTRSATDRKIAGVCGGLADYFDVDPTVVRVIWAILAIVPGGIVFGVLAYVIGWFIMPIEPIAHASPAVV
jgi:phage shock protein PspC (stress-responsive transcriptional regulator)